MEPTEDKLSPLDLIGCALVFAAFVVATLLV